MQNTLFHEHWQDLFENLPPFATRKEIYAKCRLVSVGFMANSDCQGKGIPGKKKVGKQVVYPRSEVVKWLIALTENKPLIN